MSEVCEGLTCRHNTHQKTKVRKKHAFDQGSDLEKRKNDKGQEKKEENTLSTKKVRFKRTR